VTIVVGLDVHREQITYESLDSETGELNRGRIRPADRLPVRRWLEQFSGRELEVALEATTGWRFVVEELKALDARIYLAEPAETRARRGSKKRAKTDRLDAHHLRRLVSEGRLPESWIPPEPILELRARVRLRKALVDERTAWLERIHAVLFHHGAPRQLNLLAQKRRAWLQSLELPPAALEQLSTALAMIDHINQRIAPIEAELRRFARRQAGCRALQRHFGIGELTSVAILAELGDTRRFSSSRQSVRFAGLDITVSESDGKRAPGRLSYQGAPVLRWALFEAAQSANRRSSPDHEYFEQAKQRLGANRATIAVARKLLRRAHHTLRELGEEALQAA
jgi:transposase